MSEKKLSRRELARAAALAGVTVGIGSPMFASAAGADAAKFGEELVQPENQGWEKHVPVIHAPSKVKAGETFSVTVVVGETRHHPNTVAHHIKWIQLFAVEEDGRPMVHVGTFDFGPTFADPKVTVPVMIQKTARLYALGFCNLHGVWENSVKVEVS